MGEGLKRAMRTARATRKPQPKVLMVTDSCGCVFCDLDLEPDREADGRRVHHTRSGSVICTKE